MIWSSWWREQMDTWKQIRSECTHDEQRRTADRMEMLARARVEMHEAIEKVKARP